MSEPLYIVVSIDDRYVMPAGVMMRSVCYNTPGEIFFFVLSSEGLSERSRNDMSMNLKEFNASIKFFAVPNNLKQLLPVGRSGQPEYITIATYYRLFLMSILPQSIKKVLYLDGDIVCKGSLSELWLTDITGYACAAVYDVDDGDGRCNRLGYLKSEGYFNAGVLLINLDYWRQHDAEAQFIKYIENHQEEIIYHDQDVLNALFHGKILPLAVRYNMVNNYFVARGYQYLYPMDEVVKARLNPILVHYSSHLKPWYKGCSHPFANDFVDCLKTSLWRDYKLKPYPSRSLKDKISNIFIVLGIRKYSSNYLRLHNTR